MSTSNQDEARRLIDRLDGTLIADLKTLIELAGDYDQKRIKIGGGINFTLSLVALVGCETLGFFTMGASEHLKSRTCPELGTYIMTFIQDFFPKESEFRNLGKVLADFLRHDLVHGFGNANPNLPFRIGLFVQKKSSNRVRAGYSEGKKILSLNSVALARDAVKAFYKLKQKLKSKANNALANNLVQAKNFNRSPSAGVGRQFNATHLYIERQQKKQRNTPGSGRQPV